MRFKFLEEGGYKNIFNHTQAAILVIDIDAPSYTILDVNEAYLAATNSTREALVGNSVFAAFPANPTDEVSKNIERTIFSFEQAIITRKPHTMSNYRYDIPIRGTDEFEERYWTTTNTPILDDDGNVEYFIHSPANVTELNKLREREKAGIEALKAQRQQLYDTFMQAPVGIGIFHGANYRVDLINPPLCQLYGRSVEEMLGKPVFDVLMHAKGLGFEELLDNVRLTGVAFKGHGIAIPLERNGKLETVYVDFVYEPFKGSDGEISGVIAVATEVTEQVNARRSLEEAEERARLATDAAEIGTFDLDLINQVMLTSDRFNSIFGFNYWVSWEKFKAVIHPDDRSIRIKAHDDAIKNGHLLYEVRVIHSDDSIHWIKVQGKVYYDTQHVPQRILGTVLDITVFKLLVQQKDDFISIASHELKTPITTLNASLQLLDKMRHSATSDIFTKMLSQSRRSMERIKTLVDDLLNVGRVQQGELPLNKTVFTLSQLLNSCCNPISVAGKHHFHIVGDKEVRVYADEQRIDQVIVNLVNNAVKYAPNSKNISLAIEKQDDMVKVSVIDYGAGIETEKLQYLFQRYYRINATGNHTSGLGLGLYISAEIIKRHGGEIGVESTLGKGSTFWFTLPLAN